MGVGRRQMYQSSGTQLVLSSRITNRPSRSQKTPFFAPAELNRYTQKMRKNIAKTFA